MRPNTSAVTVTAALTAPLYKQSLLILGLVYYPSLPSLVQDQALFSPSSPYISRDERRCWATCFNSFTSYEHTSSPRSNESHSHTTPIQTILRSIATFKTKNHHVTSSSNPIYELERRPCAQLDLPHLGFLKHNLGHGHQHQGVNTFEAEKGSDDNSTMLDCDYIMGSTVPNQPAGVFWAIVSSLLVIFQTIILFRKFDFLWTNSPSHINLVSEVSWPMAFFDKYFPVLGTKFGLGPLGIFQGLIATQILSHHVDDFTLVSAFFLFSLGCLNMLLGLIFREHAKSKRSITEWRAEAKGVLPTHIDSRPVFINSTSFVSHVFGGQEKPSTPWPQQPQVMVHHETTSDAQSYKSTEKVGYGFGRQGEKAAGLRGFILQKPEESLPRYVSPAPAQLSPRSRVVRLAHPPPRASTPQRGLACPFLLEGLSLRIGTALPIRMEEHLLSGPVLLLSKRAKCNCTHLSSFSVTGRRKPCSTPASLPGAWSPICEHHHVAKLPHAATTQDTPLTFVHLGLCHPRLFKHLTIHLLATITAVRTLLYYLWGFAPTAFSQSSCRYIHTFL
ncbi:hypothetical protein CPB84DRAFT_760324 [Gymnopilus junonius]|uniref:Uncharacterized protein n=1 Tax=Gymnopilus junonius TaxID=109634 RepID=A0A9P5TSY5_GYMJU|nr:hypothetical protein CPB84DRAFT_760324 [Gymnopilus junonius]